MAKIFSKDEIEQPLSGLKGKMGNLSFNIKFLCMFLFLYILLY